MKQRVKTMSKDEFSTWFKNAALGNGPRTYGPIDSKPSDSTAEDKPDDKAEAGDKGEGEGGKGEGEKPFDMNAWLRKQAGIR